MFSPILTQLLLLVLISSAKIEHFLVGKSDNWILLFSVAASFLHSSGCLKAAGGKLEKICERKSEPALFSPLVQAAECNYSEGSQAEACDYNSEAD